ncbi:MAG: LarC family nickel insertion protein [Lachnospiraceae bacterium]|nr:LarC family nickel insertion protein [Lachnospiraceae bacterium]
MKEALYLECYSGISGDMVVGALLDLGAREDILRKALESIRVQGFHIEISRVVKSGIDSCDFNVVLDDKHANHDHDMEYLYGNREETEDHDLVHGHRHAHSEHVHDNHEHAGEHAHTHEHRGIEEIRTIIEESNLTERAKQTADRIFTILAEAESRAHNVPVDQVHFHEVGAVDSIVDILAAAVCLDDLGIQEVIVTELREGTGTVRCQHGVLPVPVPAVLNILQANDIKLRIMDWKGEFITPTGAAIAAAVQTAEVLPERFQVKRVGIGAGKRVYDGPGILRAMLIEESI